MDNSKKKLKRVQGTTDSSNQSPIGADSGKRFSDKLQLSSLSEDGSETNAIDEHLRHHHHERLDNSSFSELQFNNPIADYLNEYCLSEIFSYLSLNDIMQVRRVCKKWYRVSDQWFIQVQTLVYMVEENGQIKFELYEKYYGLKIHEGTEAEKLMSFLHLYGHRIKYYNGIILSNEENLTEKWAKRVIQCLPKLCENIVDIEICGQANHYPSWNYEVMAMHWKELKKIYLVNSPPSAEKNIIKLLRNNKQLTIFKLHMYFDSEYLKYDEFFTYLPATVEEITIVNSTKLRTDQLSNFISVSKNFTSLRLLALSGLQHLTDILAAAIADIQSLTHLALKEVYHYESHETINLIAKLKDLKTLDLSSNYELDNDNLIYIVKNCIQLESLSICKPFGIPLTDRGLAGLANLRKLKCLNLNMVHATTIDSIINSCENLELFLCYNSRMNDTDAIKLLNKATNLRLVKFFDCRNLTKDVLDAANEIANRRKTNILCMFGDIGMTDLDDIITPYFKYFRNFFSNPNIYMEILPDYIRYFLKTCYMKP